jgi:hypothetical protein
MGVNEGKLILFTPIMWTKLVRLPARAIMGFFLIATASRLDLGGTQPPIQWIPVALTPHIKRPGREANQSPRRSVEIKNVWSYTSTHTLCLHGVALG